MASQAENIQQKNPSVICYMCKSDGTIVCRNCFQVVCARCKEFYDNDLCSKTKTRHIFKELKKRSADVKTLSAQHGATVNDAMADEGKEWSCSRCTFQNNPDHKICAMCATSRGFSSVDQTEVVNLVCKACTFCNKPGTKVCEACYKTLDLYGPIETFVGGPLRSAHRVEFHHRAAEVKLMYPAVNDPISSEPEKALQTDLNAICYSCESDGAIICQNCDRFVCGKCREIYLCSATKGQHTFEMSSEPEKALQKDLNAICYSCESDGAIICQNCDRFVCGKCREIYLCSATKGQHIFEMTDLRSAEGMADEETELGLGPVLG